MRLFVSINWSGDIIAYLEAWQIRFQEAGVRGYWRAKDNLHLTLKFLGEVPAGRVPEIAGAMDKATAGVTQFDVRLQDLGVFPNRHQPRILWVGVKSEPLVQLQQAVEREFASIGFDRDHKAYRPHITIASGGIGGLSPAVLEMGRTITVQDHIRAIELMESVVERGVRRYMPIVHSKLG